MQIVKLRNGSEEAEPLVRATIMSLRSLMKTKPIAVYELVMKCRDSNHQFFGISGQDLQKLSLVQSDGSVHDSVRNIILSSAEGEGFNMTFVSPVAT